MAVRAVDDHSMRNRCRTRNGNDMITAPAAEQPCELYVHNRSPLPVRTQAHHRFPEFLQRRVWGDELDGEIMWLCGLCHDAVHEWISYRLGQGRRPNPYIEGHFLKEANYALFRYEQAMRDAHEG